MRVTVRDGPSPSRSRRWHMWPYPHRAPHHRPERPVEWPSGHDLSVVMPARPRTTRTSGFRLMPIAVPTCRATPQSRRQPGGTVEPQRAGARTGLVARAINDPLIASCRQLRLRHEPSGGFGDHMRRKSASEWLGQEQPYAPPTPDLPGRPGSVRTRSLTPSVMSTTVRAAGADTAPRAAITARRHNSSAQPIQVYRVERCGEVRLLFPAAGLRAYARFPVPSVSAKVHLHNRWAHRWLRGPGQSMSIGPAGRQRQPS